MLKLHKIKKGEKGFTLIELLVVAAIIGILLVIAIPNLLKARQSANEANARKSMQTLRDAEGEYFEQDLDDNETRDYIDTIGDIGTSPSLRDPSGSGVEEDALVDDSFDGADMNGTAGACLTPKAGYCFQFDAAVVANPTTGLFDDFGWQASMTSFNKTGRRDYAVYGDGVIRCQVATAPAVGDMGQFEADRNDAGCE